MRLWKQFHSVQDGLAAASAILALAYGAVFLQSLRFTLGLSANELPLFQFYALTGAEGIVPLVGGIVALWRGSSVTLLAAWAFVVGLVFADTMRTVEILSAARSAGAITVAMASFPVLVAVVGLLLVASSRLLLRRSQRQLQSE